MRPYGIIYLMSTQPDLFDELLPVRAKGTATLIHGDCLVEVRKLIDAGVRFGAVVTDPPYEIDLHGKGWDRTGVAFSPELWALIHEALLPGGWVIAFSAARRYHRIAVAAEDAGLVVHPPLLWTFSGGLPKPANLAELFDRESADRPIVGRREGSGMTKANVAFGAQERSKTSFDKKMRGTTDESRQWMGFYYGLNCFAPSYEPILLAQRPPEGRMVENIRAHGVGALNLKRWTDENGSWPTCLVESPKASVQEKAAVGADKHPSVKPLRLMRKLLRLLPVGSQVLDPFAGTGTTGAAALDEGYHCTLIEQDAAMQPVIRRRILRSQTGQ